MTTLTQNYGRPGTVPPELDPDSAVQRASPPFSPGLRLRDFWSAADFGAMGRGDDYTDELKAAHHACRDAGRVLHIPEGVYGLSSPFTPVGINDPDLGFKNAPIIGTGSGSTIIEYSGAGSTMLALTGDTSTDHAIYNLTANAARGDIVLHLNTAAEGGLQKGDTLALRDTAVTHNGEPNGAASYMQGEVVRVANVDSSTQITLMGPLDFDYTAVTSRWAKPRTIDYTHIEGLRFKCVAGAELVGGTKGISSSASRFMVLKDLLFENFSDDNISLGRAFYFRVDDVHSLDNPNTFTPYMINLDSLTAHGQITHCGQRGGRHAITSTGGATDPPPAHIHISSCEASHSILAPFDCHPAADSWFFNDIRVDNSLDAGIQLRGTRMVLQNFVVSGTVNEGVAVFNGADDAVISNGVLENNGTGILLTVGQRMRVSDILIRKPKLAGVTVGNNAAYPDMQTLFLKNIEVQGFPSVAAFDFGSTYKSTFRLENLDVAGAATPIAGSPTPVIYDTRTGSHYALVIERAAVVPGGTTATPKVLSADGLTSSTAANANLGAFWWDPDDHVVPGKVLNWRLRHLVVTSDIAPAVTINGRVYSVAPLTGGSAGALDTTGLIATAQVATPAAASSVTATTTVVAPASAGLYALIDVLSGTSAASSNLLSRMRLEVFLTS